MQGKRPILRFIINNEGIIILIVIIIIITVIVIIIIIIITISKITDSGSRTVGMWWGGWVKG